MFPGRDEPVATDSRFVPICVDLWFISGSVFYLTLRRGEAESTERDDREAIDAVDDAVIAYNDLADILATSLSHDHS